ncbi:MAG: hypothetical protein KGI80_03275 [Verrucomicrobiota bacterium]|nr:hypothetical protein [Verrucomicrobiota bacterium]
MVSKIDDAIERSACCGEWASYFSDTSFVVFKAFKTIFSVGKTSSGFVARVSVAAAPALAMVGVVGIPIGLKGMQRSYREIKKDIATQNEALLFLHSMNFTRNMTFIGYSLMLFLSGVALYAKKLSLLTASIGAVTVLAPIFYTLILGASCYRLGMFVIPFRLKLNEIASKSETERNEAFKEWLQEIRWDGRALEGNTSKQCSDLLRRVALRKFDLGSEEIDSLINEMKIANDYQIFKEGIYSVVALLGLASLAAGPVAAGVCGVIALVVLSVADSDGCSRRIFTRMEKLFFNRESRLAPDESKGVFAFLEKRGILAKKDQQAEVARIVDDLSMLAWWWRGEACQGLVERGEKVLFESPGEAANRSQDVPLQKVQDVEKEDFIQEALKQKGENDLETVTHVTGGAIYNFTIGKTVVQADARLLAALDLKSTELAMQANKARRMRTRQSKTAAMNDIDQEIRLTSDSLVTVFKIVKSMARDALNEKFGVENTKCILGHFGKLSDPISNKLLKYSWCHSNDMFVSKQDATYWISSLEHEKRVRIVFQRKVLFESLSKEVPNDEDRFFYSARYEAVFDENAKCVDYSFIAIPVEK